METQALNCHNCGAQLKVPESANFVTCSHCDTQLAIHRHETGQFTDRSAQPEKPPADCAELLYQEKLAEIDKDWEQVRDRLLLGNGEGKAMTRPEESRHFRAILVAGLISVLIGVFVGNWAVVGCAVGVAVVGALCLLASKLAHQDYQTAREEYLRRRSSVRVEDFTTDANQNAGV